jgi:hypothetical protein
MLATPRMPTQRTRNGRQSRTGKYPLVPLPSLVEHAQVSSYGACALDPVLPARQDAHHRRPARPMEIELAVIRRALLGSSARYRRCAHSAANPRVASQTPLCITMRRRHDHTNLALRVEPSSRIPRPASGARYPRRTTIPARLKRPGLRVGGLGLCAVRPAVGSVPGQTEWCRSTKARVTLCAASAPSYDGPGPPAKKGLPDPGLISGQR